MKTQITLNLDDENEVSSFIATYGTTKGIRLAHLLGISGKGSKEKADSLSCYAWNKWTAIGLRKEGNIETALSYERICERIYSAMSPEIRW